MKKLLVLVAMLLMTMSLNACGQATRTTEYWNWNEKTEQYELVKTKEEVTDEIFDERIIIKTKCTVKL